jgi:hypothetical protein
MRLKTPRRRQIFGMAVIAIGMLIGFFGFIALAQTPEGREDPALALIGAAAFSAEGTEVGTVSAVTVAADGQTSEIRLTTANPRGLGERVVTIGQGRFIALDGAVVLDMSAAEVDALPTEKGPPPAKVLPQGTSA